MQIEENVALAPYTTLKVGGPARYVVQVSSESEVEEVRQFATCNALPVLVLGHGSNVLISDAGFAGVVIINSIKGHSYHTQPDGSVLATFGAGEEFDAAVMHTVERGYWGLENLSHIPGTVGATPIQNVGAYGVEVSSVLVEVVAINLVTGEQKTFSNQECQFGYRDSYFKTLQGRQWFITSVTFRVTNSTDAAVLTYAELQSNLNEQESLTPAIIRNKIIAIRSAKFPNWQTVGTAGSFFKNPVLTTNEHENLLRQYPDIPHFVQPNGAIKVPLGWILDKICGLRGYTTGEVSLSEHQALVLLNHGDSATKVLQFVDEVRQIVYQKTKITIELEVRVV